MYATVAVRVQHFWFQRPLKSLRHRFWSEVQFQLQHNDRILESNDHYGLPQLFRFRRTFLTFLFICRISGTGIG